MKKLMLRIQTRIQIKLLVSKVEAEKRTTALIIHVAVALSMCLHAILYAYLIIVEDSLNFDQKVSASLALLFFFSIFISISYVLFMEKGRRYFETIFIRKSDDVVLCKATSIFRSKGYLYYNEPDYGWDIDDI